MEYGIDYDYDVLKLRPAEGLLASLVADLGAPHANEHLRDQPAGAGTL